MYVRTVLIYFCTVDRQRTDGIIQLFYAKDINEERKGQLAKTMIQ